MQMQANDMGSQDSQVWSEDSLQRRWVRTYPWMAMARVAGLQTERLSHLCDLQAGGVSLLWDLQADVVKFLHNFQAASVPDLPSKPRHRRYPEYKCRLHKRRHSLRAPLAVSQCLWSGDRTLRLYSRCRVKTEIEYS